MHHNNAFCLDLLYRKRSYSDQHIRDLEYFCGSVQRPHVRGPMSPDVVALVVLVSDGWVEPIGSSGAPHSRLERVGRRAPTRPTPVSFRLLYLLHSPVSCSPLVINWPPHSTSRCCQDCFQVEAKCLSGPGCAGVRVYRPHLIPSDSPCCLTQIVAVGEVKPCELRQLPETDRVFGQFEKARVSSDWEYSKMGEEEVATKKGRRMIACSGRFHQKLLEPFFIVCEHADQWSKRGTWLASFVEQFNIKLLVIWACIQRWLVITVKIGKNSLEDVMLVIYRICTADSAELVLVCVGWLYVMLLVKYLQYCLLLSVIELCGHGFWRRRGRGLLSVWFSSDRANGFTVAQARFTLKH